MKKIATGGIFLVLGIITLILSLPCVLEATSCVTCHTNESIMKSLYRPPSIPAGEGEG